MKEVEIKSEDLNVMKKIELEMLIELDRICRKHQIKYNICAGTLLGAVRHKGFIPWDDDIDVRMLRSEYKKFCEVCEEELDRERFFLQNEETDPGYRWGFARILRNETAYVRVGQELLKQKTGIFIDIFPSDGIPQKFLQRKIYFKLAFLCRKTLWSPVGSRVEKQPILRLVYKLLSKIPPKIPYAIFNHLSKRYDEQKSQIVGCMGLKADKSVFDSQKIQQKGLKREWHTDLIELEFEGHMVYAPKDYAGWLTEAFGTDYMQLPPEEKRVVHHTVSYYKLQEG